MRNVRKEASAVVIKVVINVAECSLLIYSYLVLTSVFAAVAYLVNGFHAQFTLSILTAHRGDSTPRISCYICFSLGLLPSLSTSLTNLL
jgi:hypothetical protein